MLLGHGEELGEGRGIVHQRRVAHHHAVGECGHAALEVQDLRDGDLDDPPAPRFQDAAELGDAGVVRARRPADIHGAPHFEDVAPIEGAGRDDGDGRDADGLGRRSDRGELPPP